MQYKTGLKEDCGLKGRERMREDMVMQIVRRYTMSLAKIEQTSEGVAEGRIKICLNCS